MIHTKYSSPPDQDKIDEERRRVAAAVIGVYVHQAINRIRKRSIAVDSTIPPWTRLNWVVQGRIMMTNRWPYW
ncbi:MAG: hypothetical protein ABH837_01610 [bacterium]